MPERFPSLVSKVEFLVSRTILCVLSRQVVCSLVWEVEAAVSEKSRIANQNVGTGQLLTSDTSSLDSKTQLCDQHNHRTGTKTVHSEHIVGSFPAQGGGRCSHGKVALHGVQMKESQLFPGSGSPLYSTFRPNVFKMFLIICFQQQRRPNPGEC